jgi:hypothetical protein
MAEREVLAEIAAESLLASASSETAQPVQSIPPTAAAPRKARATTKVREQDASQADTYASTKTSVRAAGR